MVFTGFEMLELTGAPDQKLLADIDILISGRYRKDLRNTQLQWRGSENQEAHFLSDRYRGYRLREANYSEITFEKDGSLKVVGFPDRQVFDFIQK